MQEFFAAISNFGFPVVVAGYLLFRFENKIEKLDKTVSDTSIALSKAVSDNTASTNRLIETITNLSRIVEKLNRK